MFGTTPMIIFDDDLGELGPMTDLRAAFEVRTGMLTTADRIVARRTESLVGYWVPQRLQTLVAERVETPVNTVPSGREILCVNGRWRMPDRRLRLKPGEAVTEQDTDHVVAVLLSCDDAETFLGSGELPAGTNVRSCGRQVLYAHPWDVMSRISEAINEDIDAVRMLDAKVPAGLANVLGAHPVEVHESARLSPNTVLDAERGPIVVHDRAIIRPGAVICGPCSIGPESVVVDHALIKPNTVIGPVCKIGGEVGGVIFQGFSNKAHDGHLGDSWVGEWVNFGAGTTNSNLLNTYGEVVMRLEPGGRLHRTGLTFLGAVVGDHVKFAINTRIMTGSVVGTGAMIATTAAPPATVGRFAWLTDRTSQTYRLARVIDTVTRMMDRRNQVPSDAYIDALKALYAEKRGAMGGSDPCPR